jgi:hypothetical protein
MVAYAYRKPNWYLYFGNPTRTEEFRANARNNLMYLLELLEVRR